MLRRRRVREIDDVVQETAARALDQGDEYFADKSHLVGWCVVTAINYSIDIQRRDDRERVGEVVELIDWTDIADRVSAGIAVERAVAEVARLTDFERDVLFERVRWTTRREAVKFNVQRTRIRLRVREATGGLAAGIAKFRVRWPRGLQQIAAPGLAAAAVAVALAMTQLPHVRNDSRMHEIPPGPSSIARQLAGDRGVAPAAPASAEVAEGVRSTTASTRPAILRVPFGRDADGNRQEATVAPARPDQRGQLVCGEFVGRSRTCVRSPVESAGESAVQGARWLLSGEPFPTVLLWPLIYEEPKPDPR